MHAVYALQKHGELLLNELGTGFGNAVARNMVPLNRVEKLAGLGICRIDRVGSSTFAVFERMP